MTTTPRPLAPPDHPGPHGPDCPGRNCRLQHWAPKPAALTDEILTLVREGLALAESTDTPYPDPWEFIRTVRKLQQQPAHPLYIKPEWLVVVESFLESYRAAVEAAGMTWLQPFVWGGLGEIGMVSWSHWLSQEPRLQVTCKSLRLGNDLIGVPVDDLPACVDLYRRWLGGGSTP